MTDHAAWWTQAECVRVGAPLDWFYPKPINSGRIPNSEMPDPYANARQVCAACPVRTECADYDLQVNGRSTPQGMWGGLDPDERKTARARARRVEAEQGAA